MRPFALLLVLACGQAAQGQSSIVIEANAPGNAPRAVEQAVLAKLESYLDGTEGVQRMHGLALDGKCHIQLDLTAQADPQLVGMMVQNRVTRVRTAFPPLCTTKILPQADGAVMLLSLEPARTMSLADASKWMEQTVWPRLASVPGVANIRLLGAAEQGLHITLNPDRLRAYNLTVKDVAAAVKASRAQFGALSFQGNKVTVTERTETPADLGTIPIRPEENIYLRDVAVVGMADQLQQYAGVFQRDGVRWPAVLVLVQLAPGKLNPVAKQGLEKAVVALRTKIPAGMRLESRLLQPNDTTVVMRLPDGMGRVDVMDKADAAVKAMMELPQVRTVLAIEQLDEREVIFYVLADAGKQADLHKSLRAKLAGIEGTSNWVGGFYSPFVPWPGQRSQFVVRLHGKDLEKLRKTAELLRTRLAKTPGIVDVDQFPKMRQELAVTIDRERMGLAGVQPADIARAIDFRDQPIFGWPWPITLSGGVPFANKSQKQTVAELGMLGIKQTPDGSMVLLRDVAKVGTIAAPSGVLHEGGRPCVMVYGNVQDLTLEKAGADIRRIAQELAGKGVDVDVECGGKQLPAPAKSGPAAKDEQKPIDQPTVVATVTPQRMTLTRKIEQPGYLKAYETTPIYSKIAGFAEKVRVDIGDYVKKDDLLVKLWLPEVLNELKVKEARVKQAEAELNRAKETVTAAKAAQEAAKARIAEAEAAVERWSAEVSRAKNLLNKGIYDQATVDERVNHWKVSKATKDACDADWREKSALHSKRLADVEVADAQLQVSKASYQQWKDWVAYSEIRSPFDGIITQRNVHTGHFVQPPSSGTSGKPADPLFVVERIDIMRIVVQVPEIDAVAVKKGDKAAFTLDAFPGKPVLGEVARDSLGLDERTRTLRVECDVPNPDKKLRPGMYVHAVITSKINNALVLPAAAVRTDILANDNSPYCFEVVKGVARRLNLEVGFSGDEGVQVLRKREPGSKSWVSFSGQEAIVITNPAALIDGQAVAPKPAEPKKKE